MTLTLRIDNFTQLPDGGPVSFQVSSQGCEIGRDPLRDWTLPDPNRFISSRHLEIRFEEGAYVLYDVSANGTFVNGARTRVKSPYYLRNGDSLQIGHYVVSVDIAADQPGTASSAPAQSQDAFSVGEPASAPDPAPAPSGGPDPWSIGAPPAASPKDDFGMGSGGWGVPSPPPAASPPPASPAAPQTTGSPFGGPEQTSGAGSPFDTPPPAEPTPAPAAAAPQPAPSPASASPFGAAPSATPPPAEAPATASPFGAAPSAEPGNGSASPFGAPEPPAAPSVPPTPMSEGFGAAPSTDATPAAQPPQSEAPAPKPSQPSSTQAPSAGGEAVLRALCEGAGLSPNAFDGNDPQRAAYEIGQTLRVSAVELAALLRARAKAQGAFKKSSRTMLGAEQNNPLKFIPSPEEALQVMFGATRPGYQRGPDAVQSAFGDLKKHQYATLGAIQPALARLLEDLAPEVIESKVEGSRFSSKGAKAWEIFVERWDAKTHPYENGMLDVFMTYFSEAYEDVENK